ncbi:hypothetical protein GGR50DRAFT_330145 [Xylaria sp. CBS 124048]|nr:hypothetical protein GGR50DRAFT_330145 [Xylaria sp. CBS 124048]
MARTAKHIIALRRALLLFAIFSLAVKSVRAQGSPWSQIGNGFGGGNNPYYNPNDGSDNNDNNDNSDNNNNNNHINSSSVSNSTNNSNIPKNNGNNDNFGQGNLGGDGDDDSDFPSPPSSLPGPGLNAFNGGYGYTSTPYYRGAHGILAAAAFAFVFPLGSILMRVLPSKKAWLVHGTIQVVAFAVYIIAAALGIKLVSMVRLRPEGTTLIQTAGANAHPIIGIFLLVVLVAQPLLGVAHHRRYKAVPTRTWVSYAHLWLGRGAITLGIVNGGLGLMLAGSPNGPVLAYAIIAGIMSGVWLLSALYAEIKRSGRKATLQARIAPKESEALSVAGDESPSSRSAPSPLSPPLPGTVPTAEAGTGTTSHGVPEHMDLPPYTPGLHYWTHMEQIRQQRDSEGRDREGAKADFDVVPIYPTTREDMYRGQV